MSSLLLYSDHRDRVNLIYLRNNIAISKVTHAGRAYSARTAREYGASVDGAKALGGWSDTGSFKACYDRALPLDALLGAAMFDATKPEGHFIPREFIRMYLTVATVARFIIYPVSKDLLQIYFPRYFRGSKQRRLPSLSVIPRTATPRTCHFNTS